MSENYRIHFGYSRRSKYYPQAVELAELALNHEVNGEGEDIWHIVTLNDEEVDLMAALYVIAVKVPAPKIYGADIQYTYAYCLSGGTYNYVHASKALKERVNAAVEKLQEETGKSIEEIAEFIYKYYLAPIRRDMAKVEEKLKHESLIDYIDPEIHKWVKAKHKPKDPVNIYKQIRELISAGNYTGAVIAYYSSLGSKYYGELTNELIYLKRLANIPISGRDLLYFKPESSRDGLIASHLADYVGCTDETLTKVQEMGRKTPLDILKAYAPTMEQMLEKRSHEWQKGVYLWNGEFTRDSTPVSIDTFSDIYDACPEGRLFDRYPDQIRHCRIVECRRDPKFMGLWTSFSPSYYKTEIIDTELNLKGIEAYRHKAWREFRGKWRSEPDFKTIISIAETSKNNYSTRGIEYTGSTHKINGQLFFEINLIINLNCEEVGNPFLELVEEVLREAENLLRDMYGIPRIGEGWISETQLYRLVQSTFPDAKQHAMPQWIQHQHLDVFIPSRNLAFEYQGRQHFEPVDFFGGQESFDKTVQRDKMKARKCKTNEVILILWNYTEPIDHPTLMKKLKKEGISID